MTRNSKVRTPKDKADLGYARVARLRIEIAYVEFLDPGDADEAKVAAVKAARRLRETAWEMTPYDKKAYTPHVEAMLFQNMLDEDRIEYGVEGEPENPREDIMSYEGVRYVLLLGDIEDGVGELILQPWLIVDKPDILSSDIYTEWVEELKAVGIEHISDRLDEIAGGAPVQPSDKILFASAAKATKPAKKKSR